MCCELHWWFVCFLQSVSRSCPLRARPAFPACSATPTQTPPTRASTAPWPISSQSLWWPGRGRLWRVSVFLMMERNNYVLIVYYHVFLTSAGGSRVNCCVPVCQATSGPSSSGPRHRCWCVRTSCRGWTRVDRITGYSGTDPCVCAAVQDWRSSASWPKPSRVLSQQHSRRRSDALATAQQHPSNRTATP